MGMRKNTHYNKREIRTALLMSAPSALLLLVFLLIPFLMALGLSFTDQRLIPNPKLPTQFVGFRNFIRLLSNETFHRAIGNNFLFAAVVVPIQTALALGMAILVNQPLKCSKIFRTIYFSPVVITMVVVSVVWFLLYNPTQGFINQFLQFLTFGKWPDIPWLASTRWAMPAIMILSIWQGVGFQMIIFLAGLQDIPAQLYEAAQVDGANSLQKFFNVSIPQLRNTLLFVAISTTILAFKLFQQVWVMTKGGPQESTVTTIVMAYREGFQQGRVGSASAIAVVFFLIVLAISLLQHLVLRENKGGR